VWRSPCDAEDPSWRGPGDAEDPVRPLVTVGEEGSAAEDPGWPGDVTGAEPVTRARYGESAWPWSAATRFEARADSCAWKSIPGLVLMVSVAVFAELSVFAPFDSVSALLSLISSAVS
jgi:hypothetical protein